MENHADQLRALQEEGSVNSILNFDEHDHNYDEPYDTEENDNDSDDDMEEEESFQPAADDIEKFMREAGKLYTRHKHKKFAWNLVQPQLPVPGERFNRKQNLSLSDGSNCRLRDGTFFRVITSGRDEYGALYLEGLRFLPQGQEEEFMPVIGPRELVLQEVSQEGGEPSLAIRIASNEVEANCTIFIINMPYEDMNYTDHGSDLRQYGGEIYFCRWKKTFIVDHGTKSTPRLPVFGTVNIRHNMGYLEHIREHQADDGCSTSEDAIRRNGEE